MKKIYLTFVFGLFCQTLVAQNEAACETAARKTLKTADDLAKPNPQQSLENYRLAEAMLDSCGLRETAIMGEVLHNLSKLFDATHLGDAVPPVREAVRIREKVLGTNDMELAKSCHNRVTNRVC